MNQQRHRRLCRGRSSGEPPYTSVCGFLGLLPSCACMVPTQTPMQVLTLVGTSKADPNNTAKSLNLRLTVDDNSQITGWNLKTKSNRVNYLLKHTHTKEYPP